MAVSEYALPETYLHSVRAAKANLKMHEKIQVKSRWFSKLAIRFFLVKNNSCHHDCATRNE